MNKRDPRVKAWRDRLARNAKLFRREVGRWPGGFTMVNGEYAVSISEARHTLAVCKRGIEQAVRLNMRPTFTH